MQGKCPGGTQRAARVQLQTQQQGALTCRSKQGLGCGWFLGKPWQLFVKGNSANLQEIIVDVFFGGCGVGGLVVSTKNFGGGKHACQGDASRLTMLQPLLRGSCLVCYGPCYGRHLKRTLRKAEAIGVPHFKTCTHLFAEFMACSPIGGRTSSP